MGGLVIKRAYILARGKQEFVSLAGRVQAIFFLATPHRGSDLASLLSKILNLTGGARPFVTDLHRNSLATQSINDEFSQHCQDLQLYSFYETVPTSYGVGKTLIVGQDLATMGYANERREYLNANHREVCKFTSRDDANYRTIRNALASFIDTLRSRSISAKREVDNDQRQLLARCLGVSDAPEDDFMSADVARMNGSCDWLIEKKNFQQWLDCKNSPIYWVTAKPATGKTILSGRIIAYLRGLQKHCSFYFFHYVNKEKSSITSFLLSIAWQMALLHKKVLGIVIDIFEKDEHLGKADYRTIWRKLFLDGILKVKFDQTQYWVVDALDECKNESDLVLLFMKMIEVCSVRIFSTSRNRFESCRSLGLPKVQVTSEQISEEDSKYDIRLYLEASMDELPSIDEQGRQHIVYQILKKSAGCFLWVSLIFQELRNVHTSSDVRKILDEVPTDMNELYARILATMSTASYGKVLAKAILIWTVCSTRPLKTSELHNALQLDLKEATDSVEGSIESCCGQLVYVDNQSHVQMIHLTARDFLLGTSIDSEFAIDRREGHRRLLLTCLRLLNSEDMKGPRRRRLSASNSPKRHTSFINYACDSLSEHIIHMSWTDEQVLDILAKFFMSSNILTWIEYIAKYSDLNRLIQTGKALDKFLQGSSDQSPCSDNVKVLNSWATDLVRLAMKFGKNLAAHPSSIHELIPPFCPPATAPRKQFGSSTRSIMVSGLRAKTWDDCLSTIVSTHEQYSSLASSKTQFAIGTFSGKVLLYKQTTGEEIGSLQHQEPVRLLALGDETEIIVSAGSRNIRIWDLVSKAQLRHFEAPQQCMALALTDKDQLLLGALKDHRLKIWNLNTGRLEGDVDWTQDLEGMTKQLYRRPITAAFNMETKLLAIVYKGQDILLWDLESDCVFEIYNRESGASASLGRPYGSAGVRCLVFGVAVSANLLASAYTDGELVLFDTSTGVVKDRIVAFAHMLACSADGSTLASADPSGTIQLFNFETMNLVYRINSVEPGIQGLAFSGDDLRLLDIRGSRCRVWDPAVLAGQDVNKESSDTSTVTASMTSQDVDLGLFEDPILITSVVCHSTGDVFFCGKEDGSVYLYETESGLQSRKLFSHAHGVAIVHLEFEEKSHTLSSIDSSSRVMIHQLSHRYQSMVTTELLFDYRADTAIGQLVCETGLDHVLICSANSDMLWSISPDESLLVDSITYGDRKPYRWAKHPSSPGYLIRIINNEAHIFDWQTLRRLTEPAGIVLEGSILPELFIRSITPCCNGTLLATTFSESLQLHSKSKLVLWSTSDFTIESKAAAPVPDYHLLAEQVEVLVGTTITNPSQTERLIFLHGSNWICAADWRTARTGHYARHFFFPADWLSTNAELIIEVTKRGDIVLVKRDEVAVVKRGLLKSEHVEAGDKIQGAKKPLFAQGTDKSSMLTVPPSLLDIFKKSDER